MKQDNQSFLVGDLVCLTNARTQVFTIDEVDGPLVYLGERSFFQHEIEPKPLQKGDYVRDSGSDERYEVTLVDGPNVDLVQSNGHTFRRHLQTQYRSVSPTAPVQTETPEEVEEPSFRVGDLVREKGEGEGGNFTVMQLLDEGHTVYLGDGLELPHTSLEPAPFQKGNWVRSVEDNLSGQVEDIVGEAVYLDHYILPYSVCRRVSSALRPCEKKVPKVKKRTLAKVLAEIRQADAQMLSIREQRKALKKEAREAFRKVLKD